MKEIVLDEQTIAQKVQELGAKLTEDLKDEEKVPLFLCVMKGAMPFYSDLIKHVKCPILCDYIHITSYDGGLSSSGTVRLEKDIANNIDGRTVVIVEDIVDTGLSMEFLIKHIRSRGNPKRIVVCAFFDKYLARKNEVRVDYSAVRLEHAQFLVGYGLDYRELFRNVPYVYVPDEEEIAAVDRKMDAD